MFKTISYPKRLKDYRSLQKAKSVQNMSFMLCFIWCDRMWKLIQMIPWGL